MLGKNTSLHKIKKSFTKFYVQSSMPLVVEYNEVIKTIPSLSIFFLRKDFARFYAISNTFMQFPYTLI